MLQETAITILRKRFGDTAFTVEQSREGSVFVVAKNRVKEFLKTMKEEDSLSFEMLTDLFGVDRFTAKPRFEIVYLLNSLKNGARVTVKTRIEGTEAVETASDIWKAAEWLEREVYDMFGIDFKNHPDLRRILLTDDFEGHPLRKDFPTEGYDFDKPFVVEFEEEKEGSR
jgi:NADH-quinone oxidoreductase subunit C